MSNNVSILENGFRKKISISTTDGFLFAVAIFTAISFEKFLMPCIMFTILSFFYQRKANEFIYLSVGYLISNLIFNYNYFMHSAAILGVYLLVILIIKVIKINSYYFMPFVTGLISAISTIVLISDFRFGMMSFVVGYILMLMATSENVFVEQNFKISPFILGLFIVSSLTFLSSYLTIQQVIIIYSLCILLISNYVKNDEIIVLSMLIAVTCNIDIMSFGWLVGFIVYKLNSGNNFIKCLLFTSVIYLFYQDMMLTLIAFVISSVASIVPRDFLHNFVIVEKNINDIIYYRQSKEKLVEHQLNQFAQIFHSISHYYQTIQPSEVAFLDGMAQSMELLSMQLKQSVFSMQDESERIYELIKGYHYDVTKVISTTTESNQKHIVIQFVDCSRKDIKEVILPLLQMVIDKNLKIISVDSNNFFNNALRVEFMGIKPSDFKAKAYRIVDENNDSGDTCAIFENKTCTICTISDGMGVGKNASKSSGFITFLCQRLLSAGIPIEMAVKSMNSICCLNKASSFATLDFLCFDRISNEAYISKSGASPTFLIRDNEVFKIEGQSLPLGIINKVNSDCFKVQCHKNDMFIMSSDGIDENTIREWCVVKKNLVIQENIRNTLKNYENHDDASVIFAQIG